MKRKALIFLILCSVAYHCLSQKINFRHLTTNDGLATGNTIAILEDYQGFFWFGTEEGLQRYDGYSFKTYLYSEQDSFSISSNFIQLLYEDSKKNLWIGTVDGGLCLYDRTHDNFVRFKNDPADKNSIIGNFIRLIYEDSKGSLYIGLEEGGISYFKIPETFPEKISFSNFKIARPESIPGAMWVSAMLENEDHTFLVGINGMGISRFTPETGAFRSVFKDSTSLHIQCLFMDSKKRLWIGSWDNGVYVVDKKLKKMIHHASQPRDGYIQQGQIQTIAEDDTGNFWIGTDDGLSVIMSSKDPFSEAPFVTLRHDEFDPESLLTNSIKAFYIDKQKRAWVGSYFGGLNIYDRNALKFRHIKSKPLRRQALSHDNVYAFEEGSNGQLWIGTDGGGLNLLKAPITSIDEDKFQKIPLPYKGKTAEKIKCLVKDHSGNLWIGTWGSGMFRLNMQSHAVEHFGKGSIFEKSISADEILAIEIDSLNNLWIGTYSNGVTYFDRQARTFKHYPKVIANDKDREINRINDIHIDYKGNVWVVRESGGLSLFNPATKTFSVIELGLLKKNLSILSIFEDSHHTLWLGTNSIGAVRYNHQTKTVENYNTTTGLADKTVHGILEDTQNNTFWLSTSRGLSSLHTTTKQVTNYHKSDGLQGEQFNDNCALRHSSGNMLFGGISGLSMFLPQEIQQVVFNPPIVFTKFWLNDQEIDTPGVAPLDSNIVLTKSITLDHFQNSFSVEFAALQFDPAHRTQYSYKLDNFNTTWQNLGTQRKVTFTNLDPGSYQLNVKCTNSIGDYTDPLKSLTINIKLAWWQTTIFRLLVLFSSLFLIYVIFNFRLRYLTKQRQNLKRQVAETTKELVSKNVELEHRISEVNSQNQLLHAQKMEIAEKSHEIQAQNEELISQHDQIISQRENLEALHNKLQELNDQLELLVQQRTKKLEETIKELDTVVAELDRFVYSASHDLSAPLKSILGLVNIARAEPDPKELQKYYNHIESSVRKLDRVIKSLVEFSRNSHLDVTLLDNNLYQISNDVVDELAFWPEAQKVKFINLINEGLVVKTDQDRMKVVLHNLIGNAIKYADLTKSNPTIWIEANVKDDFFYVMVRDNGIGIEPSKWARIFEMYYKASDRSHGSGLGLFIVKEVVNKLKGEITVESEYGKGTLFTLIFPS